jgi:drug/metabolite transporter (DMT)-like permease
MLFAALGYALNMLIIHIIAGKVSPTLNLHQSNVGFLFMSSLLCSISPRPIDYQQVSPSLIVQVLAIVPMGYLTQYLIIRANSLSKPSYVMPFGYVSVVAGFAADVLLFGTQF